MTVYSADAVGMPFNRSSAQQRTPPVLPSTLTRPAPPVKPSSAPVARKGARAGMTVEHPKYGTGTVVRREGDSPANHSDGLTVHSHLTEAFETGLRENVLYCYRVCVSDNGATWSEGVTAQARTGSASGPSKLMASPHSFL